MPPRVPPASEAVPDNIDDGGGDPKLAPEEEAEMEGEVVGMVRVTEPEVDTKNPTMEGLLEPEGLEVDERGFVTEADVSEAESLAVPEIDVDGATEELLLPLDDIASLVVSMADDVVAVFDVCDDAVDVRFTPAGDAIVGNPERDSKFSERDELGCAEPSGSAADAPGLGEKYDPPLAEGEAAFDLEGLGVGRGEDKTTCDIWSAEVKDMELSCKMVHSKVSSDRLPCFVVRGEVCGAPHDEGRL